MAEGTWGSETGVQVSRSYKLLVALVGCGVQVSIQDKPGVLFAAFVICSALLISATIGSPAVSGVFVESIRMVSYRA